MLYTKVDCPHCGNEITVNDTRKIQKCCWCRRLVSVKFDKSRKGKKKFRCSVEAADFPEPQNINERMEKDIYGYN